MEKQKTTGFSRFAMWFGDLFGSPQSFVISFVTVIVWAVILGPAMHFSNTWQMIINTPTTIIELFAAITIQFVGNRIQRQQQAHEEKMLKMLEHVESIAQSQKVDAGPKYPPAGF